MKAVWFRPEHQRDAKKKEDYEAAIRNSRVIVDRLLEILEQRMDAIESRETDLDTYDGGAYHKLAFLHGQKKELKEIVELFSFINDK